MFIYSWVNDIFMKRMQSRTEDRAPQFELTKEALAYVENGRAKGKVIVKVR